MADGAINVLMAAGIFIKYGFYVKMTFPAMADSISFREIEYRWYMDIGMALRTFGPFLTMAQTVTVLTLGHKSM